MESQTIVQIHNNFLLKTFALFVEEATSFGYCIVNIKQLAGTFNLANNNCS